MKIYPQLKLQIQVVVVLEAIIGRTLEQSLVEVLQEEVNILNREAMNMIAIVTYPEIYHQSLKLKMIKSGH